MVRYKLMFRERGQKKFYNFGPTINRNAKPRYSKIDSLRKARSVRRELESAYSHRSWKIKRK